GAKDEAEALAKENPDFTFIFDNSKSGASLSWAHLFPGEKMPEVIKYVEDFDIWRWKYGADTKAMACYLFLLGNKPEEVLKLFDVPLDEAMKEGRAMSRYADFQIAAAIKNVEPLELRAGDHTVHIYNITSNKSEAGNTLSKERKSAVGLFTIHGKDVRISFRSLEEHSPSALDVARALGGGGHKNAAAAKMLLEDFFKAIVRE
ncbi:phosphoesterase, partial [Candidatus Parcubacteria bacterium]|nr:phosphoesterase [Candidatus Parcubacteria bacterium]